MMSKWRDVYSEYEDLQSPLAFGRSFTVKELS
jgi:hypothetical protein